MNTNDLIDIQPTRQEISTTKEMIAWWERKRLVYNLIIIVCGIAFSMMGRGPMRSYVLESILIVTPFHLLIANIFYSMGWGGELLFNYYIPSFRIPELFKYLIYIGGILFSILMTYVVADQILGFRWD